MDELAFMQHMQEVNGYRNLRPIGGGRYAGIAPFLFTHAIIVGRIGDYDSYDDRWCYHTYGDALKALEAWDGQGEPSGWHRNPLTGRRRSEAGEEIEP